MQESETLNQEFSNIFSSHYYHKLINLPTRERKNSSTLLESIYTNIPDCYNTCTSGGLHNLTIILSSQSEKMSNLPNQKRILVKDAIAIKI